eukprot:CAMPEP_0170969996 /NCGR_PEP_ID=MMETSP0735-20130129/44313_1 /TAXON_ID=186038 /ORGANISM="Fragilariopsis kerguelensis, Strain L26-C5" /LENGTH=517 /DNA_ID=CAMNT_0011389577 /DNA_START=40 /DNA_END=1594 /DNA_ORIENTATION=-
MANLPTKMTKDKKHESPLTEDHNQEKEYPSVAISSSTYNRTRTNKKKSDPAKNASNKSKKRARREALENLEEKRLTALLFGGDNVNNEESYDRNEKFFKENREEDGAQHLYEVEQEKEDLAFEIDHDGQRSSDEETDRKTNDPDDDDVGEYDIIMEDDDDRRKDNSTPAWEDPDDATIKLIDGSSRLKKLRSTRQETQALSSHELEQRLRKRYESSSQATARTDWAAESKEPKITDDEEENMDGDDAALALFSTSKSLLASSRNQLPPNILNIIRCPDANLADPNKAVIRCIDFHPGSDSDQPLMLTAGLDKTDFHPGSDSDQPLMLTAGLDKTLRFFQIGEEKSEKIHGIHFPEMPIYNASFLGNTGKVVLSGRRKFFYIYDAVAGKVDLVPKIHGRDERSWERHSVSPDGSLIALVGNDGYIVLVDSHSKQSVGTLKLNGSVRAITFTPDGNCIIASGSDGDIYRWDVKSRQCIERFANGDGTITSSLDASSTTLAVGAESGVVNLYSEHNYRQQ